MHLKRSSEAFHRDFGLNYRGEMTGTTAQHVGLRQVNSIMRIEVLNPGRCKLR